MFHGDGIIHSVIHIFPHPSREGARTRKCGEEETRKRENKVGNCCGGGENEEKMGTRRLDNKQSLEDHIPLTCTRVAKAVGRNVCRMLSSRMNREGRVGEDEGGTR